MAAGKEIRGKIKSVENTKKITKAMEMVAASKMRKAQERMRAARPYADKVRNITAHLAQYRELAAFAQFASDLDEATRKQLDRGARVTELLKQPQYSPLPISLMAASLFAVNKGFMDDVDVKKILAFESGLHTHLKTSHAAMLKKIEDSKALDKDAEAELSGAIAAFKKAYA